MVNVDLPFIVCVTPNVKVRERVARRLNDCGIVLMCASMEELRAIFCPAAHIDGPTLARVAPSSVTVGDLVIDPDSHRASCHGQPLPLTRLEWELLSSLATPPFAVWTYERLFAVVWGGAYLGDTSILHSAVKRLRRKLRVVGDGVWIETVRGVGYRLGQT
ncbi:MAG TPA: winged helix-turn-helix domain-containing protein [Micromonosporaceae bacterium]|nr:winged helix-turn-helix domain-containing protein [Micromonosporaceae bacterium]